MERLALNTLFNATYVHNKAAVVVLPCLKPNRGIREVEIILASLTGNELHLSRATFGKPSYHIGGKSNSAQLY